jgi:ComF family protein
MAIDKMAELSRGARARFSNFLMFLLQWAAEARAPARVARSYQNLVDWMTPSWAHLSAPTRLCWHQHLTTNHAILDGNGRCVAVAPRRSWLARAGRALVRVVAPDYCAACDAPVFEDEVFCEACGACPPAPSDVALGATVGGAYAPPLSTAILRLKFGQRTDLASRLSPLLPTMVRALGAALDSTPRSLHAPLVVPVPLHLTRLVERGYNAPALLGASWCRRMGLQFAPRLLMRWKETPHQLALPAEERARNVEGAFIAHRSAAGRHAILIDDVVTTGATLRACRRALYAAGVVHVTVMALAATPLARSRG